MFRSSAGRGSVLDRLLAHVELNRSEVFITNVVKCRPPENRDPKPAEILACRPYLEEQLAILLPRVIATVLPRAGDRQRGAEDRLRREVAASAMYPSAAWACQGRRSTIRRCRAPPSIRPTSFGTPRRAEHHLRPHLPTPGIFVRRVRRGCEAPSPGRSARARCAGDHVSTSRRRGAEATRLM